MLAILSILAALVELATFAALAAFLSRLGTPGGELARFAALFAIAALLTAGVRLWLNARTNQLAARLSHDLNVEAQRRLIHQPLEFHARFNSARAIAMIDKVQMVSTHIFLPAVQLVQAAVIGGAILAALLLKAPAAAIAVGGLIGLAYAVIARASWSRIAALQEDLGRQFDHRIQAVQENFAGIRDIILDSTYDARISAFAEPDGTLQRGMASIQNVAAAPRLLIEGAGMALFGLLVLLLADRGLEAMVPALGLVAFAAMRLLPLVQSAYASWQQWNASRSVLDEVMEVLKLPLREAPARLPAMRFAEGLSLRNVGFAYPDGPPILSGLSLDLPKGGRVGISGPTGCGKSTLADLVMALRSPSSGQLLVDGRPISAKDAPAWQCNIAHVGQQLFLLDASVADNVAFGSGARDHERVRMALARACLEEFTDRLDETVGERGVRLSGGQRQRLGLARAFYKDAPLMILDEATNALDPDTEARVLANIAADRTILVIGHRESALAGCDRRFDLLEGRLIER